MLFFLISPKVDLWTVLLSHTAAQRHGIACACPLPGKTQLPSFYFSLPQEPSTASFNILISALLLQQSVSLPGETEYKYLAQVNIYFSVFMDAESLVPVQNVSGEA